MLKEQFLIDIRHVPYNGGARALTGVMAGEVDLMADVLNTSLPQAKSGKVVPLALIGAQRSPQLPDIPTGREAGLETPQPGWYALVAPSGTPKAVIQRLNLETQKFFSDAVSRDRLNALQLEPIPGGAELVKQYMVRDEKAWGPVLQKLAISND